MGKSLERCPQLVDVPNGSAIDPTRSRHPSLSHQHAKLACRDADRCCGFDLSKPEYDRQRWQYVDSCRRALHMLKFRKLDVVCGQVGKCCFRNEQQPWSGRAFGGRGERFDRSTLGRTLASRRHRLLEGSLRFDLVSDSGGGLWHSFIVRGPAFGCARAPRRCSCRAPGRTALARARAR